MMRVRLWSLLVILVLGAAATDARAQTPVPTLTLETLEGTVTVLERRCNPDKTSTIRYAGTGGAFGPYVGTYTEFGTVTFGAQKHPEEGGELVGDIRKWEATFEIVSIPVGLFRITGTKRLGHVRGVDPVSNSAICVDDPSPFLLATSAYLEYVATIEITPPVGPPLRFTDRGEESRGAPVTPCPFRRGGGCSIVGLAEFEVPCNADICDPGQDVIMASVHNEEFYSSLIAPVPVPVATRPGKGCGDGKHVHERVGECKK